MPHPRSFGRLAVDTPGRLLRRVPTNPAAGLSTDPRGCHPQQPNHQGAMRMRAEAYQAIAQGLDEVLNGEQHPKKIGFAVFVFEFGKTSGGQVNYVSNAERKEMITAVREWLARAEGRAADT